MISGIGNLCTSVYVDKWARRLFLPDVLYEEKIRQEACMFERARDKFVWKTPKFVGGKCSNNAAPDFKFIGRNNLQTLCLQRSRRKQQCSAHVLLDHILTSSCAENHVICNASTVLKSKSLTIGTCRKYRARVAIDIATWSRNSFSWPLLLFCSLEQ